MWISSLMQCQQLSHHMNCDYKMSVCVFVCFWAPETLHQWKLGMHILYDSNIDMIFFEYLDKLKGSIRFDKIHNVFRACTVNIKQHNLLHCVSCYMCVHVQAPYYKSATIIVDFPADLCVCGFCSQFFMIFFATYTYSILFLQKPSILFANYSRIICPCLVKVH